MSETKETMTTEKTTSSNGTTKWWMLFLTPQNMLMVLAGYGSLVLFWNTQKNHTGQINSLNSQVQNKADQAEVKAIDDKVNKQYETMRTILERIITLEKDREYERGRRDEKKEFQNQNKN